MTTQLEQQLQQALGTDYRLERELEGGGMSRLFVAMDERLNRRVVVKVLPPELTIAESVQRFKREIELTVRLQHPHILPILTSGGFEDSLYYVTPFIEGESLRARLARDGKLPLRDVIRTLEDIAGALAFAHGRGVLHRDVKPGNILLAGDSAVLADFGIARAMSTTATPLTDSGVQPGTPAYMPPELWTGERRDAYALGVVAYEMMCGALPPRGVTAKQILTARGKVAGDGRRGLSAMSRIIARAIDPSPERAITTAKDLLAELEAMRAGVQYRAALGVAAVLVVAALSLLARLVLPRATPLGHMSYSVTTLGIRDSASTALLRATLDGLLEWRGVTARESGRVTDLRGALADARHARTRNLVALDVKQDGPSLVARATLYDVAKDSALRSERVTLAGNALPADRTMAVRRLVNGVVRDDRSELPWASASDSSMPRLDAWRMYDAGVLNGQRWDLDGAERAFRAAISLDPEVGPAQLALAQTLVWAKRAPSDAHAAAVRAWDLRRHLSPADSVHAAALIELTERRFLAACARFHALVAIDSTSLAGWLGLGDCAAQDHHVVADPTSRTKWSFESSFEAAARAYQRAAELGVSSAESSFRGWILGRLSLVLYSVTNHARLGTPIQSDTIRFGALPFLNHDTLAFAPYDSREFAIGRQDPPPGSVAAAVERNRNLLQRSAEQWVRASPQDAAAYDSLAGWMEVAKGFATVGETRMSTLDVVRRARSLSKDSTEQLRLAISDVRLLIKDGEFHQANIEADSILRSGGRTRVHEASGIAGLSTLLGHVEETARLLEVAADSLAIHVPRGESVDIPPQLAATASRLLAYASFGPGDDSVVIIAKRTLSLIDSYFPDTSIAQQLRGPLVATALSLSYPDGAEILRGIREQPDETSRGYAILANGDTAGVRRQLALVRQVNVGRQTGTAIDRNLRRARLALAVGDTAYALEELDPVLRALPTLGPFVLDQVPQAASLVRALALRAELADRTRDKDTASRCADAVLSLWAKPDPILASVVSRMKRLSRGAENSFVYNPLTARRLHAVTH